MRAAFSILGLVITLAVVLFMVKQQARSLQPEALRQEVQQLVDQAAARASEAQP